MLESDSQAEIRKYADQRQNTDSTIDAEGNALERINWLSHSTALSLALSAPQATAARHHERAMASQRPGDENAAVTLDCAPPPGAVPAGVASRPSEELSPFFAAIRRGLGCNRRGIDLVPLPGGMRPAPFYGWRAPQYNAHGTEYDSRPLPYDSRPAQYSAHGVQYDSHPVRHGQPGSQFDRRPAHYDATPPQTQIYRSQPQQPYQSDNGGQSGNVLGPKWQPKMGNARGWKAPLDFKIELPKPRHDPNYLRDTFGLPL